MIFRYRSVLFSFSHCLNLLFSSVVLMGDLNYRVRLPGKWAAPYHVALARRLIASGGFGALYEHDEVCPHYSLC